MRCRGRRPAHGCAVAQAHPHAESGLSRVLSGTEPDVHNAIIALEGFNLLPAGGMVPNPSALLARRLRGPVLGQLTALFDVVLLDVPAMDASSDAAGLSPLADRTVLVANRHTTPGPAVRDTISAIEAAGGQVIGAVINGHRDEKPRGSWLPLRRPAQIRHLDKKPSGRGTA